MLNDWFARSYAKCQETLQRRIRDGALPVLIRLGDDAILLHGEERNAVRVLSERYHALKSICHAPVALYLVLGPLRGRAPSAADLARLGAFQADVRAFHADEGPMQEIRATTLALLDRVRRDARVAHADLVAYETQVRGPIRACIHLAAQEELETLHRHVLGFTAAFDADDWKAFRVIICASHQPRYRQSAKQYFKRLLRERHGIEGQVLYGENCHTEEEALQLLATHLLDRELAEFFLGSPLDLQQDVLGDAAQRVVGELFS